MPSKSISNKEYVARLCGDNTVEAALMRAQENRTFEIELYWKKAAYFWAFIGAAFAGYIAVQSRDPVGATDLSVILACLGLVFSFAWYCVNRGSEKWQENWEKHVDMLEDYVTGPLYKTVLTRDEPREFRHRISSVLTGPAPLSVSKINQLISFYVFMVWVFLLWQALPPFDFGAAIHWPYVIIVSLSVAACVSFLIVGRSYPGGYWHQASIRTSRVRPRSVQEI